MAQGMREQVRADLEVVYYFQGEENEQLTVDPGWYLEAAGQRRVSGPWICRGDAIKAIAGVPDGVIHNPGANDGRR